MPVIRGCGRQYRLSISTPDTRRLVNVGRIGEDLMILDLVRKLLISTLWTCKISPNGETELRWESDGSAHGAVNLSVQFATGDDCPAA
jgi:hypothetical protein